MNIENELICFDAFIEIINPRNSLKKTEELIYQEITDNYCELEILNIMDKNVDKIIVDRVKELVPTIPLSEKKKKRIALASFYDERVKEFKEEIPYNLLAMFNSPYRIDGKTLKRVLNKTACTMIDKSIDAVVREYVADNKNIIEKKLIEAYDIAIKEYQRQLKFTKESGHFSQEEIQETEKDIIFSINRAKELKENPQKIIDLLVTDVNDTLDEYNISDKVFYFFNKNTLLEIVKPLRKIYLEQSIHQKITNQDIIEDANKRSGLFKEVPEDEFCQFFSIKEEKKLDSTPKVRKLSNPNDSNK